MCAHDCTVLYLVPVVMSLECFVYVYTVLYVLQCPLKCYVYTSTCFEEAVVMSMECEFLWYGNNDIMLLPARLHDSWGDTLTRNNTTTWSGLTDKKDPQTARFSQFVAVARSTNHNHVRERWLDTRPDILNCFLERNDSNVYKL